MTNFETIAGDPESTVVIHVPHGSTEIPSAFVDLFRLGREQLFAEAEIMADLNTDELGKLASRKATIKPWLFINKISRLVFDPERFDDDSEIMNSVGMGVVYTKTSDQKVLREITGADRFELIERYFQPYSAALQDLVASRLEAKGKVTIIDLHSYAVDPLPYELNQQGERPAICLGVDEFHTAPELVDQAAESFAALGSLAINTPFAGTYVPLKFYQTEPRVQSIMLEIRKDTYEHTDIKSSKFDHTAKAIAAFVNKCQ